MLRRSIWCNIHIDQQYNLRKTVTRIISKESFQTNGCNFVNICQQKPFFLKTQPLPSSLIVQHPIWRELTKCSLIWKRFGSRLPDRGDKNKEEQTRDVDGWHPWNYISIPNSAAIHPFLPGGLLGCWQLIRSHFSVAHHLKGCWGWAWAAVCQLSLAFIVWCGR